MPELEINGEKKKVACGPCIRGHRSSKCTHKDRVLIEVRKPGRPLSACPHPAGSCSCDRIVINYTIPKSSASQCACPPGQNGASANRVQKSRSRKTGSVVTASAIEKALDSDLNQPLQDFTELQQDSAKSCCGSKTNTEETITLPASAPETQQKISFDSTAIAETNGGVDGPLRLGILGVGGFRAAPDNIGWDQEFPDVNSIAFEMNGVARHLAPSTHNGNSNAKATTAENSTSAISIRRGEDVASGKNPARVTASIKLLARPDTSSVNPGIDQPIPRLPFPQEMAAVSQMRRNAPQQPTLPPSDIQDRFTNTYSANDTGNVPYSPISKFLPDVDLIRHCSCGDGCTCFACLTHPNNKTTTDYVRYHALALTEDSVIKGVDIEPSTQHQSSDLDPSNTQLARVPTEMWSMEDDSYRVTDTHTMPGTEFSIGGTPSTELAHFHLDAVSQVTSPSKSNGIGYGFAGAVASSPSAASATRPHNHTPGMVEYGSPHSATDDALMLSPSSFFLQQFALGGCSDPTGNCQCGDGCQCIGCLTHSGHQTPAAAMATMHHASNLHNAVAVSTPSMPTTAAVHPSHGSGCACPRPAETAPFRTSTPPPAYEAQTSPNTHSRPGQPYSGVHGPTCACPHSSEPGPTSSATLSVVQARAQVDAHVQLHGADCRCEIGARYLDAARRADEERAREVAGRHGSGCACPGRDDIDGGAGA